MQSILGGITRFQLVMVGLFTLLFVALMSFLPSVAQAQDLGGAALSAATSAVTAGAAVAAVILAAVILYRLIKRFSS